MKISDLQAHHIFEALIYIEDVTDSDSAELFLDVTMADGKSGELAVLSHNNGTFSVKSEDLGINIEGVTEDEATQAIFVDGAAVAPCKRTCGEGETAWLSDGSSYVSGKGAVDAYLIAHDTRVSEALNCGDDELNHVPRALIGSATSLADDTLTPQRLKELEAFKEILKHPNQTPLETLGKALFLELGGGTKSHIEGNELVLENGKRFNLDGSLNLRNTAITTLPDNLKVGGHLDLYDTPITTLPDNLTVGGGLFLRGTAITTLPDNLKVGGSLYLSNTGITTLPENLKVNGSLELEDTPITTLPDNLKVGGYLDLRGTPITTLPDNLKVNGSLYLSNTGITTLPDNLTVGGDLYLNDTAITTLPDNLKVNGSLELCDTPITTLPDNLKVGGYLDLRWTPITTLPDNLKVDGNLYLEDTGITTLPENLEVIGEIIGFKPAQESNSDMGL